MIRTGFKANVELFLNQARKIHQQEHEIDILAKPRVTHWRINSSLLDLQFQSIARKYIKRERNGSRSSRVRKGEIGKLDCGNHGEVCI